MMQVSTNRFVLEGKMPRIARLDQEWYEDVEDPEALIREVVRSERTADILTFWQRLPDVEPKYSYPMKVEPIAALPVTTYRFWWDKQIDCKTRNMVRKAEKKGVIVKPAVFDDSFIEGMTAIFNETPIRQGRRFLHYGKDFATVKQQFSRFLFREEIYGAYVGDELVGFIMLADAGRYLYLGQIISKIARRDLAPNNALLAKAVERCAEKNIPYLAYALWLEDGLGGFKRSNGFERFDLPRYFVPLSAKGKLALKLGLDRGWKEAIPKQFHQPLKKLRTRWYDLRGKR